VKTTTTTAPRTTDTRTTGAAEVREAVAEVQAWRARREREAAGEPSLEEFHVWWRITDEEVDEFRQAVDGAEREQDLQDFLQAHPTPLVLPLSGGHGRWVVPQKRLGSEHVIDFAIAEKSSFGFEWVAVELESPHARLFTRKGDPTAELTHGIRQIVDWRNWLSHNRDYATRPRDQSGLSLIDIDPQLPGWLIIGRRAELSDETRERRRAMSRDLNIRIHTYDWLLDRAEAAAAGYQ
jgi:hypothetical protein